ncbi:glycosyltransferase [Mycobacterium sp. SMC-4]|uniref:glycosyltransferase n=1 Tax=Mycobacterium sp. SMC-4 TaxID=2857059 RepID=UPI0021B16A44|nr:nucleotide disphospho-sugar-binding domain-containing protein [Mycobacterium sp. SMC-4]UXA18899.1 UDP-glucuronosyltransferase [Mycobacterium sp. SMC-4]
MKILFAMFDGGGNVPPQLGVAKELRRRGAEVVVIGHDGLRGRVELAGFAFEPFSAGRPFDPTLTRSLAAMMIDFTRVASDRQLGRIVIDAAHRHGADAVIMDMVLVTAIAEVVESSLPTVVFVHYFYRAYQDMAAGPVGWALRLRGTDPLAAEHRGVAHIVSARADLDPVRGTPAVCHSGVVWQGHPCVTRPAPTPRVLISLSTNGFAGQRRMLQHILDAVAPLPVDATVTVGPSIDATGLRVPPNADVYPWLDHDEVLATTSLVIGHGGHSTAMRALSFSVPQIVLPANPLIDQRTVGAALARAGAGVLLPKHAGAHKIRSVVETVLGESAYYRAADRLGEDIRRVNGAVTAADVVCAVARRQAGAP